MDRDLAEQMARLPWRGPVWPLNPAADESQKPQVSGTMHARQFNLGSASDVAAYSEVLNRVQQGLAETCDVQSGFSSKGDWIVLMHWRELYMCGPSFCPQEVVPSIGTSFGSAPVKHGTPEDKEEEKMATEVAVGSGEESVVVALTDLRQVIANMNSESAKVVDEDPDNMKLAIAAIESQAAGLKAAAEDTQAKPQGPAIEFVEDTP